MTAESRLWYKVAVFCCNVLIVKGVASLCDKSGVPPLLLVVLGTLGVGYVEDVG